MKEIELPSLGYPKTTDPLEFCERTDAITWDSPIPSSFPPYKVNDELRNHRPPDDDKAEIDEKKLQK